MPEKCIQLLYLLIWVMVVLPNRGFTICKEMPATTDSVCELSPSPSMTEGREAIYNVLPSMREIHLPPKDDEEKGQKRNQIGEKGLSGEEGIKGNTNR